MEWSQLIFDFNPETFSSLTCFNGPEIFLRTLACVSSVSGVVAVLLVRQSYGCRKRLAFPLCPTSPAVLFLPSSWESLACPPGKQPPRSVCQAQTCLTEFLGDRFLGPFYSKQG